MAQKTDVLKKNIEAVKQYASILFPAPELIGLLMDLNVPKGSCRHVSEFMTRRGATYTAATGLPFPRPIPSRDRFMDTWKALVKPLALDRPVSVAGPPTSGRSWPLQSLRISVSIPICPVAWPVFNSPSGVPVCTARPLGPQHDRQVPRVSGVRWGVRGMGHEAVPRTCVDVEIRVRGRKIADVIDELPGPLIRDVNGKKRGQHRVGGEGHFVALGGRGAAAADRQTEGQRERERARMGGGGSRPLPAARA